MDIRHVAVAVAAVLALGLWACSDGSSGGGGGGPPLTNLGISAVSMQGTGELWVLEVSELGEGSTDLNGDGDTDDQVPFVYDLADGSLSSLGRALAPLGAGPAPFLAVGDVLVAFGVSEADDGASDRNGDGDTNDTVLHVWDARTGVTTSTGLAAAALRPAIGAGTVAFAVSEPDQGGQDLDGDGTTDDSVLHLYDARTLLTTSAQRSVTSEIRFHDHAFAFTTDEGSAGGDLNGDGDQTDGTVLELYDLIMGGIERVPLSVRGRPLVVNVDDYFVLVDESQQGADLNGDLDTDDGVLHVVAPHLGTSQSLGLSSLDSFGSTTSGTRLAFVVQEIDGLDRNGDGDLGDSLVVLHDEQSGQTFDPGMAIAPGSPLVFTGDDLAFLASEAAQGLDLNADGDELDDVVHLLDGTSGALSNLGLDALDLQASAGLLLVQRSEPQAGEDWNGDGDQADVVAFHRDPLSGVVASTELASSGRALGISAVSILLLGVEADQGEDLNGDLDLDDLVLVLHDHGSPVDVGGANTSLGVAIALPDGGMLPDERAVFLVSEAGQGVDLNGDGDTGDAVLHRLH